MAYSLFLFMRDIAASDLVGWINQQLAAVPPPDHSSLDRQEALIGPLRNVYGVSDKVLTMALSGILIAGSKHYPAWLEVGAGMVAVDTLVYNYLHRTWNLRSIRCGASVWAAVLPSRSLCRYFASCFPLILSIIQYLRQKHPRKCCNVVVMM
jgi:hypothetical protein